VVFLLSEGVMPSNERQGYVLRRIVRRAIRAGEQASLPAGSLAQLVDPVMESLGEVYPEILNVRKLAQTLLAREEETFRRTLHEGERRLERLLDDLLQQNSRTLPGEAAFELNDTYGFPLEMTQEIAAERGFQVDQPAYQRALDRQRTRSRAGTDLGATTVEGEQIPNTTPPTTFTGYERLEQESVVQAVLQTHDGLTDLIVADTPFYAEAGGQVTDTGQVENLSQPGSATVVRVTKDDRGVYLHRLEAVSGAFAVGDRCQLAVDSARRESIRRNHTATHLLHAALRAVLGPHVAQAGSLVNEAELRFDFSHFEKLSAEQLHAVEEFANAAIWADHPVHKRTMSLEEATASGAIGLFEEEYRGKWEVRVVEVDGVSRELCGGTHVRRSGEIGLIKILSEESVAAGTRRLRAVTAHGVLSLLREQEAFHHRMKALLGDEPEAGVAQLRQQIDALSEQLERHNQARIQSLTEEIVPEAVWVGDVHLAIARADLPAHALEQLADAVEQRLTPAVVVL
ncbi:MAG TPA: alanine--tRNA ligase, partial [Candidatus Acetothermia bacterium]|nr:alanine--tRNA ligase [Candidatus Acetothermia bacterium]